MSNKIEISFILPIRNEEEFISETIDSILSQSTNKIIEIIIADGMSIDKTRSIIMQYKEKNSHIRLIDNPEGFVSTGFNRALTKSKGEIIIRIDGHAKIAPDYLQNCLKVIESTNSDCVGGWTEHVASGIIGNAIKITQSSKFGVGGVNFRSPVKSGRYVDTLAFGAYKRDVFTKIGGYDEELIRNQDDEFNWRLIQNSGSIWLDPSIKSKYHSRTSILLFFKQYFQYGFYKVRVMQKRKGLSSIRHFIPAIFILSLMITLFIFFISENIYFLNILVSMYLITNFISTIILFLKSVINNRLNNLESFLLLPFTFITIHMSYGLGFLTGLVYYSNRWNKIHINDNCFNKKEFIINS